MGRREEDNHRSELVAWKEWPEGDRVVWLGEGERLVDEELDERVRVRLKLHRLGLCKMPTGVLLPGVEEVEEVLAAFREKATEWEGYRSPNLIVRLRLPRRDVRVRSFRNPGGLVGFDSEGIWFSDIEDGGKTKVRSWQDWLSRHGLKVDEGWQALVHPEDEERQRRAVNVNVSWGLSQWVPGVRVLVFRVGTGVKHGRELDAGTKGSIGRVEVDDWDGVSYLLERFRWSYGYPKMEVVRGSIGAVLEAIRTLARHWPKMYPGMLRLMRGGKSVAGLDLRIYRDRGLATQQKWHIYDVK